MLANTCYSYCNQCTNDTSHLIAGECKNTSSERLDDGSMISFSETSSLLQCQVCKHTQLRVNTWNSENEDCGKIFYPPLAKQKPPSWLAELPSEYSDLAQQIYPALDAGSNSLALMGVRALLDVYISRHSGASNGFSQKLDALQKSGALSAKQVVILSRTFDAGSAAAHRGFLPSDSNVITALQVVENLIHQEILGARTEALQADTPPRPPRRI